jgi:hypothetical protein
MQCYWVTGRDLDGCAAQVLISESWEADASVGAIQRLGWLAVHRVELAQSSLDNSLPEQA